MMTPLGNSRSRVREDHAMIAPDSFVWTALPDWFKAKGVVLVSPRMGARFVQYLAQMEPGALAAPAASGVERVLFVLEGELIVELENGDDHSLVPGGYAYLPPAAPNPVWTAGSCRLCVFEKRYVPLRAIAPPVARVGTLEEVKREPFLGDPDALLQVLLPDEPAFDLAVNVFTYKPGATLPAVEVHIMEHGLLMLEGQGVYRLGDEWYPVQAGDAIWMSPYCPQWFVAMGKGHARYLYYKDLNRDPLAPGADV
jgi:(S)-ureidoglycine aminohydrolase